LKPAQHSVLKPLLLLLLGMADAALLTDVI
jgi:hypothetical protein